MMSEDRFIKSIWGKILKLVEFESTKSIDKNIYQKTEEEKISNLRTSITKRTLRCTETSKELDAKVESGVEALSKIEEECRSKAKNHYTVKEGLNS